MSERAIIIFENECHRIQWCCEDGDLHIIWPAKLKLYEVEAITELFQMALKQMTRLASNPAAERTKTDSQALNSIEQPHQSKIPTQPQGEGS